MQMIKSRNLFSPFLLLLLKLKLKRNSKKLYFSFAPLKINFAHFWDFKNSKTDNDFRISFWHVFFGIKGNFKKLIFKAPAIFQKIKKI